MRVVLIGGIPLSFSANEIANISISLRTIPSTSPIGECRISGTVLTLKKTSGDMDKYLFEANHKTATTANVYTMFYHLLVLRQHFL